VCTSCNATLTPCIPAKTLESKVNIPPLNVAVLAAGSTEAWAAVARLIAGLAAIATQAQVRDNTPLRRARAFASRSTLCCPKALSIQETRTRLLRAEGGSAQQRMNVMRKQIR
jgi:hypothetical protein